MKKVHLLFFCLLFLTGCSGLFDSLKEESEDAEREAQKEDAFYSNNKIKKARELSANSISNYVPEATNKLKRAASYDLDSEIDNFTGKGREGIDSLKKRRFTRADFVDGGVSENSLWNSQGQSNYFFSQNNRLDSGDLVIVNVDPVLRREIQYTLWKSLPSDERKLQKKRTPAGDEAQKANGENKTAETAAKPADDKQAAEDANKSALGNKEGDLIRMEVVENLGNGLVRLQGQKRVIYRGRAKFVEVSALARGRDIDDQSKTDSKSFLDMRARVLQ